MKISIIYFSNTGNTEHMAGFIKEGAETVDGVEVKLFNIKDEDSWDTAYIKESSAVIFGTPVYYATLSWQLKKWLDTKAKTYDLAGKIGAAFATENSPQGGGGELAIMSIYNHLLVYGMLVYSGGQAYGQPITHIGPTIAKEDMEKREEICKIYGSRIATKANELFGK